MWCQVRVIFHTVLIPILQSGSGPNEELFKPLAHALEPAQCSWVREWPSLPTLGSYSPCWTLPHWVYGMTWQPSSRNPSILVSGELSSQEELDLELSVLGPGGKWLFSTSGMCLENCIFFLFFWRPCFTVYSKLAWNLWLSCLSLSNAGTSGNSSIPVF